MEENMIENDGQRKAFGLSLGLHFILFLIAAAMGLFSAAEPTTVHRPPIDVFFYDGGGDAGGSAGDDLVPAAPAVSFPDDIVLQDKTVVQEERQEQRPVQNASRAVQSRVTGASTGQAAAESNGGGSTSYAGAGSASGAGTGGDGGGASGLGAAPPRERVEASLRAEARPEYPQELIDDDVEGAVTIKILVAADGSVEDVSVLSSSGFRAMDRAAVAAGWRFQFNPGDNGRRGVWTKTFHFQLN
ncbi:energy transducer TonB [Selenomonas timonae]|uniref:Energy transducer TonB n=1 Tax=Selenomonas timonae TaxID=2754044 RepID=A0A7G7VHF4_9FIRM|nr:energy transducer TonB [Selenomonas timonae]QNH53547.1 energy transducer TonB [Selenomonas timonae]